MNPFLTSISKGGNLVANDASTTTPTMEMIKDVSILSPLLSGQVLAYSGAVWQNIVPQSLVNDTMSSLLDVNISSLQNAQYLLLLFLLVNFSHDTKSFTKFVTFDSVIFVFNHFCNVDEYDKYCAFL